MTKKASVLLYSQKTHQNICISSHIVQASIIKKTTTDKPHQSTSKHSKQKIKAQTSKLNHKTNNNTNNKQN